MAVGSEVEVLARPVKFSDPNVTAKGERRAHVALQGLRTLWFNTGTLCNIACINCYIESSPRNDRLVYLSFAEVLGFLDDIRENDLPTEEIGITGGEPFMNPDIIPIMEKCLQRGFRLLVLTNAMRPMMRHQDALKRLLDMYGSQMTLRISVDHFEQHLHEEERGPKSWEPMMKGLEWLAANGFTIDVAGRTRWGEQEQALRDGFARLFEAHKIPVDAYDPKTLMLFPEMDVEASVPEITTECWNILNVDPNDMMCATSRMVVKHRGDDTPSVMACTLLAYDDQFNLGNSLSEASSSVSLNHPHCAKFCVLGGGACSAG